MNTIASNLSEIISDEPQGFINSPALFNIFLNEKLSYHKKVRGGN